MSEESQTPADRVRLEIPATAEYVVLARLAVSGIGSRIGFSYDDVEDLKVIAAEICRLFVGDAASGNGGRIAIEYTVGPGRLTIDATAEGTTPPGEPDDLSLALLEALTDECDVGTDGNPHVRVVKQIAS